MYTRGLVMALSDTWLKANNGRERSALEVRSDQDRARLAGHRAARRRAADGLALIIGIMISATGWA